jgi:phospholipid/cholesterol/gamma-HCH transport system substrate-binding protein
MDLHYKQEITVGTLVLIGLGVFVGGTMWLKGASFRPHDRIAVIQFSDIGNLKRDNEVTVSGVPVGKVEQVDFKAPGKVLVTVSVRPSLELRADASAAIESGFFSSDSRLLLDPGSPGAPPLEPGAVIRGSTERGLFAKGADLADRADSVLIGVQALANERTAQDLRETLHSLQRVLNTLNQRVPATSTEAEQTLRAVRNLSERLDSTVAAVPVASTVARADTLATRLAAMTDQLTRTGEHLDSLLVRMGRGEGTLGRVVSDTGLYQDMRATLQALRTLLDELNKNPGKITVQVKLF